MSNLPGPGSTSGLKDRQAGPKSEGALKAWGRKNEFQGGGNKLFVTLNMHGFLLNGSRGKRSAKTYYAFLRVP